MNLIKLGLGALLVGALSGCPGGNNNNDPVCGNGTVEAGEQCDDGNTDNGDGCSSVCTEEGDINLECPRLVELNKMCVPLPGTGGQISEVAANADCGDGFFKDNPDNNQDNSDTFQIRKLFSDTIIVKETNNFTSERPVMAIFIGQNKVVVYDSGDFNEAIVDIAAAFANGKPIELINTHLHGDHINNNPDIDVIAIETPEVDAHCGINANSFDANNAAVCNNATAYNPPNDQELFNNKNFVVIRVVRDGHKIDLGNGRELEILATPGHSETSTTIHDPTHRLLFTGDTLYPDDEIPLIHPNGSNGADYLETAQKYAALEADIDVVIGAHSQGTMPARVLGQFLTAVQNQQDVSDATCDAGGFSFANFP